MTMASSRLGRARMMSISRMIMVSTQPRAKPATRPRTTPMLSESVMTMAPISSEKRAP